MSHARLFELIYWLFLNKIIVCKKYTALYDATVLTSWMARDDCHFTSRDLRISYDDASQVFASIARCVPKMWSPIPFMRMNFERMSVDFFDPFTAASHVGRLRISSTTRWLPHSHANRHWVATFSNIWSLRCNKGSWFRLRKRKLWLSSRRGDINIAEYNLHLVLIACT